MNRHEISESQQQRTVKGSFAIAFAWVMSAWVIATTIMVVAIQQIEPASLSDSLMIAVGSLAVATAAMLPGLLLSHHSGSVVASLMAGIMIRLIGTVALFLTCRYQLASSLEMIAAMAVTWYVFLTIIEVSVLGWSLPKKIPTSRSDSVDAPVPAGV